MGGQEEGNATLGLPTIPEENPSPATHAKLFFRLMSYPNGMRIESIFVMAVVQSRDQPEFHSVVDYTIK